MAFLTNPSTVRRIPASLFAAKARQILALFIWGILLISPSFAPAQPAPSTEYRLKAVFLFNFAQFVEWPAEAFTDTKSPLVIGILGTDPFGSYLDETVKGEVVQGRTLEIKRFRAIDEVDNCHILFVSTSESSNLEAIFNRLSGKPILTAGDGSDFASRGGMVRFLTESKKIRLRINLDPVRASKLTISSKLLRVAEIVGSQKEF